MIPSEFCPDNTVSPNEHSWVASKNTGRRWCGACGESFPKPVRVNHMHELKDIAEVLGVRPDWHEPDEQKVTAHVFGNHFDNAGTWPYEPMDPCTGSLDSAGLEMYVELRQAGMPMAHVNLATLFAFACGYRG